MKTDDGPDLAGPAGEVQRRPDAALLFLDADSPQPAGVMAQPQHQLVLRPVALSGQLDRMSLVYQLEGNELHFAEYHRWAGSLDAQLNQLTLSGLSSRLPGWVVRQDGARKGLC